MSAGPTATTSITITLVAAAAAGPFTLTIPQALKPTTDTPQGVGVASADSFVRLIYRNGGFWATDGVFYPWDQIQSISST